MQKLIALFYFEFISQNKTYNLIRYLLAFSLFYTIVVVFVAQHNEIQRLGMTLSVLSIPLALLSLTDNIIPQDQRDGHLAFLLMTYKSYEIILIKFFVILVSSIISFSVILLFLAIVLSMSIEDITILALLMFLLFCSTSSLIVLLSSVQTYFTDNTDFLVVLLLPLTIPNIIMTGLTLQDHDIFYIFIMLGINLLLVPFSLLFASYLVRNVYS